MTTLSEARAPLTWNVTCAKELNGERYENIEATEGQVTYTINIVRNWPSGAHQEVMTYSAKEVPDNKKLTQWNVIGNDFTTAEEAKAAVEGHRSARREIKTAQAAR